jgi:hypothetical protein
MFPIQQQVSTAQLKPVSEKWVKSHAAKMELQVEGAVKWNEVERSGTK